MRDSRSSGAETPPTGGARGSVDELGIRAVTFHGRVSEERKLELMREAHVHLFCSHREGWGLVVSEAAAMGTPSIGYDAPGVRDSIADRRVLAPIGDVGALKALLQRVRDDPELYEDVRQGAWERARLHERDKATRAFADALLAGVRQYPPR